MLTRDNVQLFLQRKAEWSQAIDQLAGPQAPRLQVPIISTPAEAWAFIQDHGNPYTGDPVFGLGDYYLAPTRLVAGMKQGLAAINRLHIDCDDIAGLAFVMLRDLCQAKLVTLVDPWIVGSHVLATAKTADGRCWAIDTNGCRELADLSEPTLCQTWRAIYESRGYDYTMAIESPYPF